jgi:hypothetical protein
MDQVLTVEESGEINFVDAKKILLEMMLVIVSINLHAFIITTTIIMMACAMIDKLFNESG